MFPDMKEKDQLMEDIPNNQMNITKKKNFDDEQMN
jgi:hypothetical protein